jgi:hypothetical protein
MRIRTRPDRVSHGCAAENTFKALNIQADALQHGVRCRGIETRNRSRPQENNRKLDNPSAVTSEKLYSVAFKVIG